jgi:hypothetical protein
MMQDTGFKIQDSRYRIQDTGYRDPWGTESKICPVLHGDTGYRIHCIATSWNLALHSGHVALSQLPSLASCIFSGVDQTVYSKSRQPIKYKRDKDES